MKPFELKSMTYEEARREHFTLLMNKAKRKKDYWSARLDHKRPDNLMDEAHIKASDAGWEYNFYKDALEALENQPKWISVEERLPDDGVDVLVWFEYFRYGEYNRPYQTHGISFMFQGRWSGFVNGTSGWTDLKIIAWMPLPSCPEEDS